MADKVTKKIAILILVTMTIVDLGWASPAWAAFITSGSSQWSNVTGGINYGAGNVGIGTTTPGVPLHILSTGAEQLRIDRSSSAGNVVLSAVNNTGATYFGRPLTNFFAIGPNLDLSSNPYLSINTSGNVGIGTIAPGAKLDVNGGVIINNSSQISEIKNITGTYPLKLSYSTDRSLDFKWLSNTATFQLSGTAANHIQFITANNGNILLTPSGTGNVGIGTTAPGTKLDVAGSLRNSGATTHSLLGGSGNVLVMADNTGSLYSQINPSGTFTLPTGFNGQTLRNSGGTTWVPDSNLFNNGTNVGIGTTNPGVKLDVSGGSIRTSNQLISSVAVGTAPIVVTSNTLVTNLNADLLDGVQGSTYYKDNDVVMNTNPFGGRRLYINSINDAMFRAESRWVVTGNYYNSSTNALVGPISSSSLSYLFDGSYETQMQIPAGQYAVVNVNFSTESGGNFPGYPYGYFYISHYHTGYSQSASVRTYSNYVPHGVGWHDYNFSTFYDNGSSSLILRARNDVYAVSQVEFKIYAPAASVASISAIDWQLDRPGTNDMPLLDKYKPNSLFSALSLKNDSNFTTIILNPSGNNYFNSGNVGVGTTNPGTKLDVSGSLRNTLATTHSLLGGAGNILVMADNTGTLYATSSTDFISANSLDLWEGTKNGNIWNGDSGVGNVGIGTTTPAAKLHIVSNTAATQYQTLQLENKRGDYQGIKYTASNGGGDYLANNVLFDDARADTAGTVLGSFFTIYRSGALSKGSILQVGNTIAANSLVVSSSGNVGIGTTAPSLKLEVKGVSGLAATSGTSQTGILRLANTAGTQVLDIGQNNSTGLAWIQPTSSSNLASNWNLSLNPNGGNVGIGTTNPGANLSVIGDMTISSTKNTPNLWINTTGTGDLLSLNKNAVKIAGFDNNGNITTNGTLVTSGAGNSSFAGNVGIGTTAPGTQLDVAGSLRNSGATTHSLLGGSGNVLVMADNGGSLYSQINPSGTFTLPTGSNGQTLRNSGGTTWVPDSNLFNNGTNVGIGTTNPIYGKLQITSSGSYATGLTLYAGSGNLAASYLKSDGASDFNWHLTRGGSDTIGIIMKANGNVGIGTTNPGTKLHVAGTSRFDDVILEGVSNGRIFRNLGTFYTTNSGPGAIVIQTAVPQDSHTFTQAEILVYELTADKSSCKIIVGGYWSSEANGGFSVLGYNSTCANKYRVRIARQTSTGNVAIILEDVGSTWSYPFVSVTDFMSTYSISDSYADNWTIGYMTDLSNYSNIDEVPDKTILGGLVRSTVSGNNYFTGGNVGIGTTAPGTQLDVAGSLRNSGATTHSLLGGSGNVLVMADNGGSLYATTTSSFINPIINSASGWTANGTTVYKTDINGNVGIGTTNPSGNLEIAASDVISRINLTSGSAGSLRFSNNGVEKLYTGIVNLNNWGGLPSGTAINDSFTRFDGGMYTFTAGTTRHVLSMLSSGNVGIGITVPTQKLQVIGNGIIGGNDGNYLSIRGNGETNGLLLSSSASGYKEIQSFESEPLYINRQGNNVIFNATAGNVGIGNTNPGAKLQVGGGTTDGNIMLGVTDYGGNSGQRLAQIMTTEEGNGAGGTLSFQTLTWNPTYALTTKMVIQGNNGNVGIGTTAPGTKLDVAGSIRNSGATTHSLLAGAGNAVVMTDNTGTLYTSTNSSLLWSGTRNGNIWNGDAGVGNVGIGTTNPTSKLSIDAGANTAISLSSTGYGSLIQYRRNGGSYTMYAGMPDSANSKWQILNTSLTSLMSIDYTGNVGIGITNPSSLAEIQRVETVNRTTYNDILTVTANAATNPYNGHGGGILFKGTTYRSGTGNFNYARIGSTLNDHSGSTAGSDLFFDVSPLDDGVLSRAMTIKYSGNVGIGTIDPGNYRLKVAGNMAVTGTFETQTGSDFAEEFLTTSELESGTVVVMGDLGYKSAKPASHKYDRTVVGIVSDNPSIIAGRVETKEGQYKAIIAMAGVVSVKVTDTNGAIYRGDLLASSDISGYAMKTNGLNPGTVIGKALEDLHGNKGEIKVLVNLQ